MDISKIRLVLSISYLPKLKKEYFQMMMEISPRGKDTCESDTQSSLQRKLICFQISISEELVLHAGITNTSDATL